MSIALYSYMCHGIIGTEEHVKTIRMMNNIRDFLNRHRSFLTITSGSLGEGIQMRGSDVDMMYVNTFIEVSEDVNIQFISGTVYFTMASEDTSSCFTKLSILHSNDRSILNLCNKIGSDYFLSGLKVKESSRNKLYPILHGPCISDKFGIFDMAFTVRSKSWITQADQWITRSKNGWSNYDLKQCIVKHGVLFVPIGLKGSKQEDLEWRISFSVGEKLLIYSFTHTQLICYALLKIVLKDVINTDMHCKDLLCSYFIKTVILWISEEVSTSIWKPRNLIPCFSACFKRLIYYVKYSLCPHYFIPMNNLFANKITGEAQEILLKKLYILKSYNWQCMFFSDQISNPCDFANTVRNDPYYNNIISMTRMLSFVTNLGINANIPCKNMYVLQKVISKVMSIKSSKIKSLYMYFLSKRGSSNELQPFDNISDNKFTYKQYKTCVCSLLLGTRHDAVSGWLLLASFFYTTREYRVAVDILQYCLLKCTPDKLYHVANMSHVHAGLLNLNLFRRMGIVQLSQFLLVDPVRIISNSLLVPNELRINTLNSCHFISPVVYVHALRFLCHFHLFNTKQCQDSLLDLKLTIENKYCLPNSFQRARSYKILYILFLVYGDTESAKHAFMQSKTLFPDSLYND
ncbi:Hypothetical predicted protein [Mytilus galloprovincialis]|uniref:Mab-21-like HhH/H2TH-like domain-containing protein n=1 Tax=Mytilus galloprovincialis TaxID=29158 RepID=A0A8B6BYK8_MYTGA|nr:Hypothetical predicted protein [Mytilus galloprovincialis]